VLAGDVNNDFIEADRLKQIAQKVNVVEVTCLKKNVFNLDGNANQYIEYWAYNDGRNVQVYVTQISVAFFASIVGMFVVCAVEHHCAVVYAAIAVIFNALLVYLSH
jgi:hypothetical protein